MASGPASAQHYLDMIGAAGQVSLRRMFGEYAVYLDGRTVGFICDDQLFLKLTPASRAALPEVPTGHPYPGAKDYLLIDPDFDDADRLVEVIRRIAADLPPPRPKTRKRREIP